MPAGIDSRQVFFCRFTGPGFIPYYAGPATRREQAGVGFMEYIDLTPTWVSAVTIYMAVLENPDASAKSKKAARDDILKLAATVDENRIVSPDA